MAVLKQLFRGVLYKKMFLEILKNSQGNICARVSFLKKLEASCNFITKETVFPVSLVKFLSTPILKTWSSGKDWRKKSEGNIGMCTLFWRVWVFVKSVFGATLSKSCQILSQR